MSLNHIVLSSKFSAYFQMAVMMSRSVAQRLKSLSKIHCASTILEELPSAGTYSMKKNITITIPNMIFHDFHMEIFHFPHIFLFFHSMWGFSTAGAGRLQPHHPGDGEAVRLNLLNSWVWESMIQRMLVAL